MPRGTMSTRNLGNQAQRQAKLSAEQVREMRRRHKLGESQASLADELGINRTTAARIVNRQTWAHLED